MNRHSRHYLLGKQFVLTPLIKLMSSSSELAALQTGIQQVSKLETALKSVLPSYLASHVYTPPIKNRALTIFAAHSALATRLRHLEPTMLAKLQQRGFALLAIKIRVCPKAQSSTLKIKQARVSSAGADCLWQLANTLESSPLQQAISRMAHRHISHRPNNIRPDQT
ncbi:DUF721 domain-containing protein [Candidatus Vallotia lariciata]|uniref:DUF721 domain-containing protein n=1 Tax=Candidatus Vallotia laricis TaxID=2018052 RepID=UPI001D034B1F|nr:DUF721 domain-containing protein [Candidatus Vallotia lariciata]UDG82799.1 hypothetical protein GKR41_00141 [Candidatus Vallotia lariciata]